MLLFPQLFAQLKDNKSSLEIFCDVIGRRYSPQMPCILFL